MTQTMKLIEPRLSQPLDPGFRPAALANRAFRSDVRASGQSEPLVIALERDDGSISRYETVAFAGDIPVLARTCSTPSGCSSSCCGSTAGTGSLSPGRRAQAEGIQAAYRVDGDRAFDARFMGEEVYLRPFEVIRVSLETYPPLTSASCSSVTIWTAAGWALTWALLI
jgi:hypothetical protein